jgi:hypothetical protein
MIQRKQTLFLFQLVFLGIALLFVPVGSVSNTSVTENIYMVPLHSPEFQSTSGHQAAIILNFVNLLLAFTTIFLYKKRELQVKLCYVLMFLWLLLGATISFCPFAVKTESIVLSNNYFGAVICLFAVFAAYLAARNVKKDIELIKSADRIR